MKVLFDSNVWRIVAIPDDPDFANEGSLESFEIIRSAILKGKIEPYLSETVFTIEAIRKIERQNFFSSTNPNIKIKVSDTKDGAIGLNFQIGPNSDDAIDFEKRPILKKYFDAAKELGFKIVRLPRIAGLVNPEIDAARYNQDEEALKKYHNIAFEVLRKIEDKGAGMSQIKNIGMQYGNPVWMKGLKHAPEKDWNRIAKAGAEWADGDSVATSIGLQCDYFCTRDRAKGAGSKSVLSTENLQWLNRDYNFKTILPEKLADMLKQNANNEQQHHYS